MDLTVSGSSAPNTTTRAHGGTHGGSRSGRSGTRLVGAEDSERKEAADNGSMRRATQWSPEVEDLFRLQAAGWVNEDEYRKVYGAPERWQPEVCADQFISKLQVKSNGYFTYWRKYRECEDSMIRKVKIYV